jgi:endonuclease/exonuclease/phosphatase (EEP) superfamily protein YafD
MLDGLRRLPRQPARRSPAPAAPGTRRHRPRWSPARLAVLWGPWLAAVVPGLSSGIGLRGLPALALALMVAWSAFLTCHLLFDGRWGLWLLPALMPPPLVAVVPAALSLFAVIADPGHAWPTLLLGICGVCAGWPATGLNARALARPRTAMEDAAGIGAAMPPVRILVWNTEHWNQRLGQTTGLYEYLRRFRADIYLLQEYSCLVDDEVRPIFRESELAEAFPGFHIVIEGPLVTMSRFPVLDSPSLPALELLRVDVSLGPDGSREPALSTYNVHIPVPLIVGNPWRPGFHAEIKRRRASRAQHFEVLLDDLRRNRGASFVAGDLNASPAMADSRLLHLVLNDAIRVSRRLLPVSWHGRSRFLRLWRLDWAFVSPRVSVLRYDFRDPSGLSDHCAQDLVLRLDEPPA